MLAAYLLDPARRGYPLRELCEDRGIDPRLQPRAAWDAAAVQALAAAQRPELAERGLDGLLRDVELPLVGVLRSMELAGIALDIERLAAITTRVSEEVAALERTIWAAAGEEFLIGSPQQLGAILFDKLALSRKRRGKTGYSTDARVLAAIRGEHEIVPLIERWRERSTLVKTYLEPLPSLVDERSRLHTTFLQTVASTGRLSSVNPNLQNVPIRSALGREIRGCFVAGPGTLLLAADYSQVELRVLAQIADEPVLKEIFRRGEDVHTATACQVFSVEPSELDAGMRSKAKMINYGIVYGLTDFGLADRLQIPREEAAVFIATYFERFPAVRAFIERTIAQATQDGYVTTLLGRRRQIPEGDRGRHHQGRDGPLPPRAGGHALAPDPADPRRAAVRGSARGDRARACDRGGRDVRGLAARPAARGRRRRRPELARREVGLAAARMAGLGWSAAWMVHASGRAHQTGAAQIGSAVGAPRS
jgi:DNA polymerase-1